VIDDEAEKTGEQEALQGEVERLRQEAETLSQTLQSKVARIVEQEKEVTARDTEVASLQEAVAGLEVRMTGVNEDLFQAVAAYRGLAAAANPEIPTELIGGDTIEAVEKSLENARALVDRVKEGIEAEASRSRVPAGSPHRAPLDLSALSPREKIQYAIGGNR
jgi:hypothetical protein